MTSLSLYVAVEPVHGKVYPEVRMPAMGYLGQRLHVLCFTPVAGGVRVISFRKANAREARDYEQTRPTD